MRKHFPIGKTFLGSCKAQMFGHKRVSCPRTEHKYSGDGRRSGGSIVQHQERKLCCVQKPIYYNNCAILTDWASCLLCGIGMKIYLFSEIQLLFCLHSPCPMAFYSSLLRNISQEGRSCHAATSCIGFVVTFGESWQGKDRYPQLYPQTVPLETTK